VLKPSADRTIRTVRLASHDDFDGWRSAARTFVLAGVAPEEVLWQVEGEADLFGAPPVPVHPAVEGAFSVPRPFVDLAQAVICHRDPERFSLLFALLCRLRRMPGAMEDGADPLLGRLAGMARSVRRDMHKMRAFLRFRQVSAGEAPRYVAWFEPEHHILRANAGFFVRRFAGMRWSILTPEGSLHWDGEALSEGPGAERGGAPDNDPVEEVWKTYYASIFNPARVKIGAMLKEMPKKYWRNMPETALVRGLIAGAQTREREMVATSAAGMTGGNVTKSWESLRAEALRCTRCELHKHATQTVFGEGPLRASIVFVGEQPADQEDLAGKPFVGPAGQLFDRALAEAGIDRSRTYVTNAVKHFKFERRGKRRIHDKPNAGEIEACRWWLERELALIRPAITVALGATAARSLFGRAMAVSALRGEARQMPDGGEAWVTVHPSYLLRVRDRREEEYAKFVEDLRRIAERVRTLA